jgi:hypothetical protein
VKLSTLGASLGVLWTSSLGGAPATRVPPACSYIPVRVASAARSRFCGSFVIADLAVVMGTSIRELEDTYFRWLRQADDQLRRVFDEYDLRAAAQTG